MLHGPCGVSGIHFTVNCWATYNTGGRGHSCPETLEIAIEAETCSTLYEPLENGLCKGSRWNRMWIPVGGGRAE